MEIKNKANLEGKEKKFLIWIGLSCVPWTHITFHLLSKGYTVPGNQGTHEIFAQFEKIVMQMVPCIWQRQCLRA